jgi:hypothetical protein
MDQRIASYPCVPFGELNLCYEHGVAYQRDTTAPIEYDADYFEHYVRLENTEIARQLNAGRTALAEKYCGSLLDIGVGSGEFMRACSVPVAGYDINPVAVRWLKEAGLYFDPYAATTTADGVTFWDAMEHIPEPHDLLGRLRGGVYVFVSMPIFTDLTRVRRSKHYKPNEHLYYFTTSGMIRYMADGGFDVVEMSDFETRAGREDILTFVFKKRAD